MIQVTLRLLAVSSSDISEQGRGSLSIYDDRAACAFFAACEERTEVIESVDAGYDRACRTVFTASRERDRPGLLIFTVRRCS